MPTPDAMVNNLATFVAAAGALGTACFGIVEGLKWTSLGELGFGRIVSYLGPALLGALKIRLWPRVREIAARAIPAGFTDPGWNRQDPASGCSHRPERWERGGHQ